MEAPQVAVDPTSLGDGERTTSPPPADELQVVDEATPDDLAAASVNDTSTQPPPADELQVVDEATPDDLAEAFLSDLVSRPPPSGESESVPRMESGPVPATDDGYPVRDQRISNVHTRPTVRRMIAVDAAAVAAVKRRDPRREEE